jgi:hypothetical protein
MSVYSIVEKYQQSKNRTIAIRPYVNYEKDNMGLQNYGMALHEGVWHHESLACLELNGIKRYVTGLNEFAPEVKLLTPGEKDLKIKEIRKVVSDLEKELAANVIDPKDKDFWNKVSLLKPDNHTFWSKIELKCGNDPLYLDPVKDPYDLIKLYAINAGGFSIVAKSLKEAKKYGSKYKFYLDHFEESVSTRTEYTKLRNKALVQLQTLFDKNTTKLMYVAKCVDIDSTQYTKSTPNDILYERMDMFINGEGSESNKKKCAESFIEAAKSDMKALKVKALVKDCMYYRFITSKPTGWIETLDSAVKLGKKPSEVMEFLFNPENEEILSSLLSKVEPYWNT